MKRVTIKEMPDRKETLKMILSNNKGRRSYNRTSKEEIEAWMNTWPSVGEEIELENAQQYICRSGLFACWEGWDYPPSEWCLSVSPEGKVSLSYAQKVY